jgi:hypothetical protein
VRSDRVYQIMTAAIVDYADDLRHQRESYAVTMAGRGIQATTAEKQEATQALRQMRTS